MSSVAGSAPVLLFIVLSAKPSRYHPTTAHDVVTSVGKDIGSLLRSLPFGTISGKVAVVVAVKEF